VSISVSERPPVAALLIGVCLDIFSVLWDTSLQTHVPLESLSRVSAYDALGSVALAFDGVMEVDELSPDNHSLSGTISNIALRK